MTLPVELRTINTLANIDTLEFEYSSCSGISGMIASIKVNINSLKSLAVDAVTDKINNMMSGTAMYGLQCAAQALPTIGDAKDAFDQSMKGITTMAKGDFFNSIDTGISDIPSGLSCFDVLSTLSNLNELCESIISKLASLIDEYLNLENLQKLILSSLGTIGALLGCGLDMFGGLEGLDPKITDINTTLKSGLSAVSEAKDEGMNVLDINTIAKEKIVDKLDLAGQMSSVKNNLISKIADLG